MNRYRLRTGSITLVAASAAELQPQAEWLLGTIRRMHEAGMPLVDGGRIRLGWSVLTVRRTGDDAILCEPDFAGDPFSSVVEDLTRTLWVQARQADVLGRLGLEGEPTAFSDKVVHATGCLGDRRVYLERQPATGVDDSGWFIGPTVGGSAPDRYEGIHAYQLLFARPAALQVLCLPVGYLAVLEGEEVAAVVDPTDGEVWNRGERKG